MTTNQVILWKYKNTAVDEKYQPTRTFHFDNTSITIQQQKTDITIEKNTGNVVWDGAFILSDYILRNFNLTGKRVIELGAGTGLVGLAASSNGAITTVTDITSQVELLKTNINLNPHIKNINADELLWGINDTIGKYDYIFGSEILYLEDQHLNLIQTCKSLSTKNTVILMIYKHRGLGEEHFLEIAENEFQVDIIPKYEYHKEFQNSEYTIFQMYLK
ncbi:Methyltransferase-like protein 21A [Boothiomyces sp. JEL0838]|nr:Methyltransferase-like protein 21A [Boothiomyces sp. JEL0838]